MKEFFFDAVHRQGVMPISQSSRILDGALTFATLKFPAFFAPIPGVTVRRIDRSGVQPMDAPPPARLMPSDTGPYLTRVSQCVPVEMLALYLIIENLLNLREVAQAEGAATAVAKLAIFTCLFVATPLYVWWRRRETGTFSVALAGIAGLAFIAWAYVMGGSIFMPPSGLLSPIHNPALGAMMFTVFIFSAGFVFPNPPIRSSVPRAAPVPLDGYTSGIAKYVPVEALGGYLVAQNLLGFKPAAEQASDHLSFLSFAAFVICLATIPFVLWSHGRRNGSLIAQAAIAVVGYLVWVYAIGGSLFLPGIGNLDDVHNGPLAALMLLFRISKESRLVGADRSDWIRVSSCVLTELGDRRCRKAPSSGSIQPKATGSFSRRRAVRTSSSTSPRSSGPASAPSTRDRWSSSNSSPTAARPPRKT
jgi:hypothetical protein